MHQKIFITLLPFVFWIISPSVQSVPITYNLITFEDWQYGAQLTGTITLNDGVRGRVELDDIQAWSFSGDARPTHTSTDIRADTRCGGENGCFLATSRRLFFDFGGSTFDADSAIFEEDHEETYLVAFMLGSVIDDGGGTVVWNGCGEGGCGEDYFPPGLTVVGRADGASVLEPATGLLTLLAGIAAYLSSRKVSPN